MILAWPEKRAEPQACAPITLAFTETPALPDTNEFRMGIVDNPVLTDPGDSQ